MTKPSVSQVFIAMGVLFFAVAAGAFFCVGSYVIGSAHRESAKQQELRTGCDDDIRELAEQNAALTTVNGVVQNLFQGSDYADGLVEQIRWSLARAGLSLDQAQLSEEFLLWLRRESYRRQAAGLIADLRMRLDIVDVFVPRGMTHSMIARITSALDKGGFSASEVGTSTNELELLRERGRAREKLDAERIARYREEERRRRFFEPIPHPATNAGGPLIT